VDAAISGGLTDFGGDGVSITPISSKIQTSVLLFPSTPMGVDVGDAASHVGTGVPATYTYGVFADGPKPGPAGGPWTGLSASTVFTLSGGSDVAALTGFAHLRDAAIPEGGPGLLGIAAIAGLALVARFARTSTA